jgi:hypothetical protein
MNITQRNLIKRNIVQYSAVFAYFTNSDELSSLCRTDANANRLINVET